MKEVGGGKGIGRCSKLIKVCNNCLIERRVSYLELLMKKEERRFY